MASPLYPALAVCVLCLAACKREVPEPPPVPAREAAASESPADGRLRVVFLGNSIAAGYGLDPSLAFPALVRRRIDSLGWPVAVVNAGVSGETTAGGLSRIEWLLRDSIDVLVIELGGNDGLRGIRPEVTKANLQGIIDAVRLRHADADVILAGMQVPPNLGPIHAEAFRAIFPDLARDNDIGLVPFLLEGVAGRPELNLPDGIHPTAEGQRILAETVWDVLGPVLEARLP